MVAVRVEARFGDQVQKGGTKVNLFLDNAKSLRGGKMFSAALFVLIDCQFAQCPHLSGESVRERVCERRGRERENAGIARTFDKSPPLDVKKRYTLRCSR